MKLLLNKSTESVNMQDNVSALYYILSFVYCHLVPNALLLCVHVCVNVCVHMCVCICVCEYV